MGKAALPLTSQRTERGATVVDHERMGIWWLRELARQTHPEHVDEAARVFVRRFLNMEVERRLVIEHENCGWHTHSPMARGLAPGGTDIAREPLALAYDRGIRLHSDHEAARRWIVAARLSPRNLLAVLVQARKLDRRVQGEWGASYEQIAIDIQHYPRRLGSSVSGHVIDCIGQDQEGGHKVCSTRTLSAFKDGKAITNAAAQARTELILLAKAGT
ncbi:hypothetical protein HNO53_12825 [Billgrantia antri]|uniref:Uncharacterized protein n=1 Tax=Halomonas sulfidivorans TaxID=2733488 RepID=A0ABX7WGJ4_9GAMM|nr:hypothetical protein [Halomonas sulfidivorans]QTP59526.1 hypothetical protein HNO53_12825 [Halomonas sulfidivorans]